MPNQQIRCLYIEDDDAIREEGLTYLRLKFRDIQFIGAASFSEAIAIHEAQKKFAALDFVISDFIFQGKDGAYGGRDFVAHLRQQGEDTPVAIYSRSKPELIKDKFKEVGIEIPDNCTIIAEKTAMRLIDIVVLMKRRNSQPARPTDATPERFWVGSPNPVG